MHLKRRRAHTIIYIANGTESENGTERQTDGQIAALLYPLPNRAGTWLASRCSVWNCKLGNMERLQGVVVQMVKNYYYDVGGSFLGGWLWRQRRA